MPYPLFVRRDLDGFFGLLLDNLVQLLLIPVLCAALCGMRGDDARFLTHHILPGAAMSVLIGNLYYAWQARRLALRTGRSDVTALPYGINTPSMLIYILFVMQPAYQRTHSAEYAWKMGLFACLGSGLIEFGGSFIAEWVRKRTPRAALLSTLAGIAIGFISMQYTLQIFQKPLVAMLPLAILFVSLFSRVGFPLGLPAGLLAVLAGAVSAWLLPGEWTGVNMSLEQLQAAWSGTGFRPPVFAGGEVASVFGLPTSEWLGFLTVIIPMGLFNVIGSLQNIESAEAAGDQYNTCESLAVNGVGTIIAALFGSCFPTTIYIGHAGWKGMGARAGYSTLNGLVISLICLFGAVPVISAAVPVEAGMAIVLWIGIIITAQAFQTTPPEDAPAVAIGLFPAIAAWGLNIVQGAFMVSGGKTLQQALTLVEPPFLFAKNTEVNGYLIHGMILIERGYIFTCMSLAAIAACLVHRKFGAAAIWATVSALFTAVGLTHAYQVKGNDIDYLFSVELIPGLAGTIGGGAADALTHRPFGLACGYLALAVVFLVFRSLHASGKLTETEGH